MRSFDARAIANIATAPATPADRRAAHRYAARQRYPAGQPLILRYRAAHTSFG